MLTFTFKPSSLVRGKLTERIGGGSSVRVSGDGGRQGLEADSVVEATGLESLERVAEENAARRARGLSRIILAKLDSPSSESRPSEASPSLIKDVFLSPRVQELVRSAIADIYGSAEVRGAALAGTLLAGMIT